MSLGSCLLVFALSSCSHADVHDEHLLAHFAAGTTPIEKGLWCDMNGSAVARLSCPPEFKPQGPAEFLLLHPRQSMVIEPTSASGWNLSGSFSVAAWCFVQTSATGLTPFVGADFDGKPGWRLGVDAEHWFFERGSNQPAADRLVSRSKVAGGRWCYVVATYDQQVMRLYLNGRLEGELAAPEAMSAPAANSVWLGGADSPAGGLLELKVWDRVLAPGEILLVAARNGNLVDAEPAPEADLTFVVEPILQFGTKESMTFVCETSSPTTVEVHFGPNALLGKKVASQAPSLITELTVAGLETFHEYFYRVDAVDEKGRKISSPLRSFQTAPPAELAWAFGVVGDTQRNPEVTRKCAQGMFACRPNFVLHCGDVVDDGFAKNQWVKDLFEPCKELLAYVPMFPVIGNHEKNSHWYYDYFALPKPENRYTFEYGNAEFFMVDSNRPLRPGSEQYQWLEKELSESKATWKIAAHHHPCFSSDEDDYGDHVRGRPLGGFGFGHPNAKHLIKLYEKYGVDIVFNGHIHVYERTWPIFEMAVNLKKGVRYVVSGGGGGGLESPSPQRTWFSLHVNRTHHYCHVAVFDRTLAFKAYDVEGRLFDSFEMTKADDR
jgi:predicted phosphodiesterase